MFSFLVRTATRPGHTTRLKTTTRPGRKTRLRSTTALLGLTRVVPLMLLVALAPRVESMDDLLPLGGVPVGPRPTPTKGTREPDVAIKNGDRPIEVQCAIPSCGETYEVSEKAISEYDTRVMTCRKCSGAITYTFGSRQWPNFICIDSLKNVVQIEINPKDKDCCVMYAMYRNDHVGGIRPLSRWRFNPDNASKVPLIRNIQQNGCDTKVFAVGKYNYINKVDSFQFKTIEDANAFYTFLRKCPAANKVISTIAEEKTEEKIADNDEHNRPTIQHPKPSPPPSVPTQRTCFSDPRCQTIKISMKKTKLNLYFKNQTIANTWSMQTVGGENHIYWNIDGKIRINSDEELTERAKQVNCIKFYFDETVKSSVYTYKLADRNGNWHANSMSISIDDLKNMEQLRLKAFAGAAESIYGKNFPIIDRNKAFGNDL